MGSEWKTFRIGDIAKVFTGRTPPGTLEDDFSGDTLFVTPGDMTEQKVISRTVRTLSSSGADKLSRIIFDKGIVVSCIGWQMGKSAVITQPAATNQQINTVLPDEDLVDLNFLYYSLKSKRDYIFNLGATATRTPIVKKSLFEKIEFKAPPLPKQKAIAHILGSLDDKIELNRRMNATLEQMAQALFKSWFVDFDPVTDNALAAGNAIPEELAERGQIRSQAIANGTANRDVAKGFPAAFQLTEEMGWIPEGWEAMPFKSFTMAKTARVGDQAVPEYSSTNEGLFPRADRFKKQLSKSKANNKLINYGDLVFGMSRQVLNFGLMHQEVGSVSSAYNVFEIDQSTIFPEFVEYHIRARPSYYYGMLGASSREGQSLSITNFNLTSMLIPRGETQEEFQRQRKDLVSRQLLNSSQSECLTKLRDTLLPKLISGELRIPDAERIAKEAMA